MLRFTVKELYRLIVTDVLNKAFIHWYECLRLVNQYCSASHGGPLIVVAKSFRFRREQWDYAYTAGPSSSPFLILSVFLSTSFHI